MLTDPATTTPGSENCSGSGTSSASPVNKRRGYVEVIVMMGLANINQSDSIHNYNIYS